MIKICIILYKYKHLNTVIVYKKKKTDGVDFKEDMSYSVV